MQEVIQEKDLFRGYEMRNWNFSPRIYKILAASAIFNVLALVVFAQTNLLTKKGCDSPFVSTICQVLDTVYVGNTLFGTDGEYVVKEYNKTEIGEDEEVTFIDVSNVTPPLSYPANYFAISNPDQYHLDENGKAVQNDMFNSFENMTPPMNSMNPPFPNNQPPLINSTPNLPPTNNNPTTGKLPDSPWEVVNTPPVNNPTLGNKGKKPRKGGKNPTLPNDSPDELKKPDGNETADKDKEPKVDEKSSTNSDPVKEVELNKKPFQELGSFVATKWAIKPDKADNKIEIKPFKVALNAKLTKKIIKDQDGKEREVVALDGKKSKWLEIPKEEAGDEEMVNLAKEAIEAVGDSGFLGHLYNLGMKDLKITLIQKDNKIFAAIESEQPTPERAQTLASGLNGLIAGAKLLVKGEDEKFLLSKAQPPTSKGKMLLLNVELPKDVIQEMIVRKIAEDAKKKAEEEKKNNPIKGTAQTLNSNTGK
jgi:hypothetical protein